MRVLHLIPDLPVAGAERVVADLARYIDRERFTMGVVSMYDPQGTAIEEELARGGLRVSYLGKRPGLDPRMVGRIQRAAREFRPDIVHTHRYVLRYLLPSVIVRRSPPVIHTLHNVAEQDVGRPLWVQRLAYAAGVVPVAICDEVAASLRRAFGITTCPVIRNGIEVGRYRAHPGTRDATRRELGLGPGTVAILSVGRLSPQKNHGLLLEALARLAGRVDVRLLVAGIGERQDALQQQASQLRVGDKVRFLGLRDDVPALLAAADLFAQPSAWEGNPLTVMEALAAGVPVVATAVGGVPELVSDGVTGRLVPAGDGAAMAAALEELARDGAMRAAMGQRAAQDAELRFDVRRMVTAYEQLYEETLAHVR